MPTSPGLELIESFLVVAEELNFRRSSERLNVDQSALTRRIQKLEATMGFALFERTTREVSLTPAGRTFYEESAGLVRSYQRSIGAARLVAEGKTGSLRVAYMTFAAPDLMPRAIARYKGRYPHVDVRLNYMRTQGQKLALAHDEIDLGYMIGPFEHSEFHTLLLRADPLHVVMPAAHALAQRSKVSPQDLAGEELVIGDEEEWEAYRWEIDKLLAAEGINPSISLQASNTLALNGLVEAGLGITIYPQSLVKFLGDGLRAVPIDHPDFRIETILVWKRLNRARTVAQFVDVARGLKVQG
ncbi:LysR family transcriptional regulator [Agrobacterium pusense]|uniref:HTH-type transcriptional regulator TtuA n=1 Tax=Agrobacterium pusense TaxID=648995 RepID=A0AA44IXP6_9HYPH|nr:LysR family transcriptional regulator [Agrobacterium pusense]MDH0873178.1 LysR family transcriptional regulator [Agrobacterium pusense]NRF07232.1 LysR family transcriptional regulator [Agrobacterium pusense]NRF17786.1 LysR family transcriptional regulator [Agrobacterium pusense]PZU77871.1 MAG: LysR family transcriptional regulator [Rhizobium sp.]